jgi:two-component system, OmpR family, sensor kinase
MRSASEPARARRSGRSLATRVVLASLASAAAAGGVSAAIAVVAVDRLASEHDDQRLRGAAIMLAGELDEERVEEDAEGLPATVRDENEELAASGMQLAFFRAGRRVAGEEWVPAVPDGACESTGSVGGRVRACARNYDDGLIVAATPRDHAALRVIYPLAALSALLLGAVIGAVVGLRAARWALAPLDALTAAIGKLDPGRPALASLAPRADCHEIDAIRAALVDLLQRIDGLLAQAQRFAADAAHELRSPLTMIRGELELLLEEPAGADRARIAQLRERSVHLGELVERLLVLAVPPDAQRERFEPVALSDLVAEVIAELPDAARARVRTELHEEGLTRGEPLLLRALLRNAIDNALKFATEGEVTVTVREDPSPAGTHSGPRVRLEVRDRGPGVPSEQRARVFEPFYRLAPQTARGHGLGLPLIGHIAEVHGGHAELVDAERGACLVVKLPAWTET